MTARSRRFKTLNQHTINKPSNGLHENLASRIGKCWGEFIVTSFLIIPAAGVMTTRPVIMPCTAPITDGLPKKTTSNTVQTRRLMAAQMLVLMTAMEESMLAA